MSKARRKLIKSIHHRGTITVEEFIEFSLFDPEWGYYRTHFPIGCSGDFTTAPEISQMFGEIVGLWAINLIEQFENPQSIALVELGPGRGTLMTDILRVLALRPNLLKKIEVHLLEINSNIILLQKERLKNHPVTWHNSLETLLETCDKKLTVVLANEFFDVFPIRQYVYQDGWFERLIKYDDEQDCLGFTLAQTPTTLQDLEEYPPAKIGDMLELNQQATRYYQRLLTFFSTNKGGMLIFDYGYTQPLYGESLQAVKQHRFVPVLDHPGECDLTAHVNFWRLLEENQKFTVQTRLISQGQFLIESGIRLRAAQLAHNKPQYAQRQILSDLERLTSATEMGDLFKVLEVHAR